MLAVPPDADGPTDARALDGAPRVGAAGEQLGELADHTHGSAAFARSMASSYPHFARKYAGT
jgi:hypothetical protein